jgi:CDP-paratose 2-epimerase
VSILEAYANTESITGIPMQSEYVDQNRVGDHICYYSDLRRMRADYPDWDVRIGVNDCIRQIVDAWRARLG